MHAVFINAALVIIGTILGILVGKLVQEDLKKLITASIGLVCLLIGIKMAVEGQYILAILGSLLLGGILGHFLKLEDRILDLGHRLKSRFAPGDHSNFAQGFLSASLLFCVGAMSILGSIKAGTEGDISLILIKSVMDGFMAFIMAGSLGLGVGFSAISIIVYQGGLTLAAQWIAPYLNDLMKSEINGLGGILILAIALDILGLKKIKTAELLPSLVLIVVFVLSEPLWKGYWS